MTRKSLPVHLTIAAVFLLLGIEAIEMGPSFMGWDGYSSWFGWTFFISPQTVRLSIIWMISCFLAMRHGSASWTTRAVPIALGVFVVASHTIPSYAYWYMRTIPSSSEQVLYKDLIAIEAAGEVTSLLLAYTSLLFFSTLLNVSLRRIDGSAKFAPLRVTVHTILIVTTCIAIFLALQNWVNAMQLDIVGAIQGNRVVYLTAYVMHFVCNVSALFGVIWIIVSRRRRRWLGVVGLVGWLPSPVVQVYQFMSPDAQSFFSSGAMASYLVMILFSQVAGLAVVLVCIPILRLFGYQFRIGSSESS